MADLSPETDAELIKWGKWILEFLLHSMDLAPYHRFTLDESYSLFLQDLKPIDAVLKLRNNDE